MPVWAGRCGGEADGQLQFVHGELYAGVRGIAALDGPQDDVTAMVAEFRRRRDAIVKGSE